MDEKIQIDLKGEVFFSAEKEQEYFMNRLDAISNYSNAFFKQQALNELGNRYIRALANIDKRDIEQYEIESLRQTYIDFLAEIGIDSYIIDSEIENYKSTHSDGKGNIFVSSNVKK